MQLLGPVTLLELCRALPPPERVWWIGDPTPHLALGRESLNIFPVAMIGSLLEPKEQCSPFEFSTCWPGLYRAEKPDWRRYCAAASYYNAIVFEIVLCLDHELESSMY